MQSIQQFPQEKVAGNGPVGKGNRVIREGECISSLAENTGLFAADIFDDPANAELKTVRGDPNILLPGDRLTIPLLEIKDVASPTSQTNTFRLRAEPVLLRIQVKDRDVPMANQPFTLVVGSLTIADVTQDDGTVEARIPPGATSGFLTVGTGEDLVRFNLKLGALSPVANAKGVQQRLQNLGFNTGPIDGIVGPLTRAAVRNFQTKFGLVPDGIIGPITRERLKTEHGC